MAVPKAAPSLQEPLFMGIETGMVVPAFASTAVARPSVADFPHAQRNEGVRRASPIAVSGDRVVRKQTAQRFGCFGARS